MGVLELRDLLESTESPEKEVLWVLRGLGESLGYLASTDKKGTLVNEDRRANQGFPPLYQVGLLSKAFVRSVLRFFLLEILCVGGNEMNYHIEHFTDLHKKFLQFIIFSTTIPLIVYDMKKVLHITPKGCYINSFHTIVCNTNIICGSDAEYFFLIF